MPKQKKARPSKARKPRSRRAASKGLGLWIFAGIICVAAVWLIIRPVAPVPSENKQEIAPKPRSAKAQKAQPAKPSQPETPAPAITDPDTAIAAALGELGMTDQIYKRQKRGGNISYLAPLDKSTYDLYFANMILKGRMEKIGGKLESAVDEGKRQILSFNFPDTDKKWKVELYYDPKPYVGKIVPKTLAIVVDDFGEIGGDLLNGFLNLPKEVTFAIFPEMKNSVSTMERAHAQGRESIIHVPMEPIDYPRVNPGKNAILVSMKPAEISRSLNRWLDQMHLSMGINNHMGSLATTDPDVMAAVMAVLKERNKLFLDSRTSNVSVAYSEAQKAHLQAFRNSIFLDSPDVSDATMEAKIRQLETMSEKEPHLIAITHCHNHEKLVYLVRFIDRMRKAGYTLVPLSKSGRYKVPQIL